MTSDTKDAGEPRIGIRFPRPDSSPQPLPKYEPANYFHFSHAGADVAMAVGIIDPQSTAEAIGRGGEQIVEAEISHRFLVTLTGVALLHKQLSEILAAMQRNGLVLPEFSSQDRAE